MSARELKMVNIKISHKFASFKETQGIEKSLLEYIDIHVKNGNTSAKGLLLLMKSKTVL